MIAYAAPIAGFLPGDLVPHPENPSLLALKKPNGKFVCVTPDGKIEERDAAGSWESFRRGKSSSLIAERDGKVYVLPCAE